MRIKFLHFIALLFIAVISYTTAHKSFVRLSYEINKLEIIEKFCINKEETTFKCDGKCHLKSQFEKTQNHDPSGDTKIVEENTLILFSIHFKTLLLNYTNKAETYPFLYSTIYSFLYTNTIFPPPKN